MNNPETPKARMDTTYDPGPMPEGATELPYDKAGKAPERVVDLTPPTPEGDASDTYTLPPITPAPEPAELASESGPGASHEEPYWHELSKVEKRVAIGAAALSTALLLGSAYNLTRAGFTSDSEQARSLQNSGVVLATGAGANAMLVSAGITEVNRNRRLRRENEQDKV